MINSNYYQDGESSGICFGVVSWESNLPRGCQFCIECLQWLSLMGWFSVNCNLAGSNISFSTLTLFIKAILSEIGRACVRVQFCPSTLLPKERISTSVEGIGTSGFLWYSSILRNWDYIWSCNSNVCIASNIYQKN